MSLGKSGEDLAVRYLRRKKYRIIERNFRSRLGEIDIIACHDKTLVFCEVKTRTNKAYGHPFESVTAHKQKKIRQVAEVYLATSKALQRFHSVRFDVISVLSEGPSVDVVHIENAF